MSTIPQGSIMSLGAKRGNYEEELFDSYNI